MAHYTLDRSPFVNFFVADTRSAWLWLVLRLYLGYGWLTVGWEKIQNPAWLGNSAGTALTGFMQGALAKTGGAHPDVQVWYAWFLEHVVIPHAVVWSYLVACGEVLVGLALLFGFLTGVAAFFGMTMNFNYLLAGSISVNPIWLMFGLLLLLSWRISGYIGLDRWVLPRLFGSIEVTPVE